MDTYPVTEAAQITMGSLHLTISQAINLSLATVTNILAIVVCVNTGSWLWRLRRTRTMLWPWIFGVFVAKFALWYWTLLLILSIVILNEDPRPITLSARVGWLLAVMLQTWVATRMPSAPPAPNDRDDMVVPTGPTVLIVEDDQALARIYRRVLQGRGYQAEFINTGTDALTMLAADPPSVLIVDLGLPDMDGMQLLDRARQAGYRGPAIAISGAAGLIDDGKVRDRGVVALLAKPFTTGQLLEAVAAAKA